MKQKYAEKSTEWYAIIGCIFGVVSFILLGFVLSDLGELDKEVSQMPHYECHNETIEFSSFNEAFNYSMNEYTMRCQGPPIKCTVIKEVCTIK